MRCLSSRPLSLTLVKCRPLIGRSSQSAVRPFAQWATGGLHLPGISRNLLILTRGVPRQVGVVFRCPSRLLVVVFPVSFTSHPFVPSFVRAQAASLGISTAG